MLHVSLSLLWFAIASSSAATLPLYFEPASPDQNSRVQYLSRGNGVTSYLAGPDAAFNVGHSTVIMKLSGAKPSQPAGLDKLSGTSSYFVGHDPKLWRTGVPQYGKVSYRDVYPGIDRIYYGAQGIWSTISVSPLAPIRTRFGFPTKAHV